MINILGDLGENMHLQIAKDDQVINNINFQFSEWNADILFSPSRKHPGLFNVPGFPSVL